MSARVKKATRLVGEALLELERAGVEADREAKRYRPHELVKRTTGRGVRLTVCAYCGCSARFIAHFQNPCRRNP